MHHFSLGSIINHYERNHLKMSCSIPEGQKATDNTVILSIRVWPLCIQCVRELILQQNITEKAIKLQPFSAVSLCRRNKNRHIGHFQSDKQINSFISTFISLIQNKSWYCWPLVVRCFFLFWDKLTQNFLCWDKLTASNFRILWTSTLAISEQKWFWYQHWYQHAYDTNN